MLKTNSKKAVENIRAYIMKNFDPTSYTDTPPTTFPEICRFILKTYEEEKYYSREYAIKQHIPDQTIFREWAAGLPPVLDTCYYYNRSAVADLGSILEETPAEMERYTESGAETLLTNLIYRELKKGAAKND